jgi:hypothetical protein
MSVERSDNLRNLSLLVPIVQGWYNLRYMKMRLAVLAMLVVVLVSLTPAPANADATLFLGRTFSTPNHRSVRGFGIGMSLLVVGFEFEIASIAEDQALHESSLRTTSGNVFVQTPNLTAFQLYLTTGAGVYREHLGADQSTGFVMNNGGGVKVTLAGPLRLRVDYRIFNLRGTPQHSKLQRVYAGLNLAF